MGNLGDEVGYVHRAIDQRKGVLGEAHLLLCYLTLLSHYVLLVLSFLIKFSVDGLAALELNRFSSLPEAFDGVVSIVLILAHAELLFIIELNICLVLPDMFH